MSQPTHDDERRDARCPTCDAEIARLAVAEHGRHYSPGCVRCQQLARDAGWVDPEEARVITEQRDRAWRKQAGAEKDRDWLQAQRDALLPVAEAARALIDVWDNTSMVEPDEDQMRAGYVSLVSAEDAHAVEDAFDRLSQLVGAALDQKVPETALSATQSAEPPSCGPSCVCHPEPLVDVSGVPLKVLADADTALGRSVARVAGQVESDDPNGVISAFSSFVE